MARGDIVSLARDGRLPREGVVDLEWELVERARGGNRAAWQRLYVQHHAGILRHVSSLVGSADIAEDLTQDVFAIAIRAIESFRGDSELSTWLSGIAINVVRRHWRRANAKGRMEARLEDAVRCTGEATGDAGGAARLRALRAVLDELPVTLREAFILKDLEGLSEIEVAERLGISQGNASMRASRARRRIKDRLVELGWLTADQGDL